MKRGKLAYHLRKHVVQIVAVRHAVNQGKISIAHLVPIDALHFAIVEVVTLQSPGIHKQLVKLGARIRVERPPREVHPGLGERFRIAQRGGLGVGIENVEILALRHQELLAIERQLVTLHVAKHGFRSVALVGDIHAGEIALGRARPSSRSSQQRRLAWPRDRNNYREERGPRSTGTRGR